MGSIAVLLALIALSGVFSATEMALVSVNRNRARLLAEQGDKKAVRLLEAIENPGRLLATILIGNTVCNMFSSAFAADVFSDPAVEFLINCGIPVSAAVLRPITFFLITLLMSYCIMLFGEMFPKRLGMKLSMQWSRWAIGPLNVFSRAVHPFAVVLTASADMILKLFGLQHITDEEDVTEEDIRMLVESGSEHGSIAVSEHDMINNIFEFDNKTAEDACIHRTDVIALPVDAEPDEIMHMLSDEKYTRIPVFDENIDDILGILHVKDLMRYIVSHRDLSGLDLKDLLREPYFVPFSKKIDELFQEMQKKRVHMAVVIDEYGGTLGIVTMEDLVEEIVGNIFDEHDEVEQPDIMELDENTFRVSGATDLEIVEDYFGVPLPVEDYDTLSGFLIGQLGNIPSDDEKPELEFNGLMFKVEGVSERRISSIIVCKT